MQQKKAFLIIYKYFPIQYLQPDSFLFFKFSKFTEFFKMYLIKTPRSFLKKNVWNILNFNSNYWSSQSFFLWYFALSLPSNQMFWFWSALPTNVKFQNKVTFICFGWIQKMKAYCHSHFHCSMLGLFNVP